MGPAYRLVGSYRAAAEICGTTDKTVKRVVEAATACMSIRSLTDFMEVSLRSERRLAAAFVPSPQATTVVRLGHPGREAGMTGHSAGTDQRGERHPYLKPFVRNLDVEDTDGVKLFSEVEFSPPPGVDGTHVSYGPS